MVDLKTKFAGLELPSPIIAGSCGLTADISKLEEMAANGAGAVILKSIFEEQIHREASEHINDNSYPEETDYIRHYIRANTIQQYIDLVKQAKVRLSIPVIGSISCLEDGEWIDFARELEKAGADAIELNAFILPTDEFKESADIEAMYYAIVRHVKSVVSLPIIIKIGRYFTNLPAFVSKLKAYGADAVTVFNRFYEPDIDIERMAMGAAPVFSTGAELRTTLRWTGILCGKDRQLQLSASTGVHSGEAAIKLLLAGAGAVQVCSVLYEEGIPAIRKINDTLREWMERKGYASVADFRGKLSYADAAHAERYERAQFMKYFSDKK